MAYPSVRSSSTGEQATGVTSHTVQLPATVVVGDYLFVAFNCDDNASSPFTVVTWDNSSAGTWTQLYSSTVAVTGGSGGAALQEVWYKVADGTEDGVNLTILTSLSQPSTYYTASIQDCSDIVAGTPTTNSNTSTSTPDPPSLTTGWGAVETLFFVILGIDNGTTTTVTAYPTSYTDNQGVLGSGTGTVRTARASRNLTAGSDDPGTFTLDNARPCIVNTIAFKPLPTGLQITSVDTDNAVLAGQSQATFAGTGLASTAKFAVKRGSAIAYGADISLSGSTGGSFTAPTMTAMFSAGVRFGDVAFFAAETSGTAIASISGSITTATNWKYVNVTDLSATGSMGSLFYNNAVSLSDQVAYSSVTTRFRWPVTVSGDGYFTVNSSGSQAGDEFAYRIWDETDSTWGTEGTIEINGGISSAEQVYAAGSLVQVSLESSTLEGATLQ